MNRKIGDARASDQRPAPTTKALTPAAWQVLLVDLEGRIADAGACPSGWLCVTRDATAMRGDIRMTRTGALLVVVGKESKRREVAFPGGG